MTTEQRPAACLARTALFPRFLRLNLAQNPDETLYIRQLENGLERHRAHSRPTTSALASLAGTDGKTTFRHPQSPGQIAPPSELRRLEPTGLAGMTLVIDRARDWLGPAQFADDYPETGQAKESVRFCRRHRSA
jgi:hypothetical protein